MVTVRRCVVMIDNGKLPPDVGNFTIGCAEADWTAAITDREIGRFIDVRSAL